MQSKAIGLILCLLMLLLFSGCDGNNNFAITQQDHRSMFFQSLKSNVITDYQFIYQTDRRNYTTLARVTTSNGADYDFLKNFTEIVRIQNSSEQEVLRESMRLRAASLVGTNSIPAWFYQSDVPVSVYFEKKDSTEEIQIWRNDTGDRFYMIGIGRLKEGIQK